jgi:hypothetical protein
MTNIVRLWLANRLLDAGDIARAARQSGRGFNASGECATILDGD